MSPAHSLQAAGSRPGAAVVVATVATALVACSEAASPVRLPARPPAGTSPVAATSVAASPRQQVIAALTGYTVALGEAARSRNAAKAGALLRPYLAASQIDGTVQTMSTIWAKGEVFVGEDVLHILSVTVTGTTAFAHDCDDTSAMGLEDAAAGTVVPGSVGVPHLNLVTRLGLVRGHWLVQSQLIEDVPCTA